MEAEKINAMVLKWQIQKALSEITLVTDMSKAVDVAGRLNLDLMLVDVDLTFLVGVKANRET